MNKTVLLNTKRKNNTSKINSVVLVFLMYMLFFRQIYSYHGMPFAVQEKGSFVYEQMSVSNSVTMMLSIVAVFCILILFVNIRFSTIGTYLCFGLVMVIGVCLWTFLAVKDVGMGNILYSSMPPYVYLTALMFCVGMKEDLFKTFLTHAKILGILSTIACIIALVSFLRDHNGSVLADSSILRYYIQGFWLLCIYSFCSKKTNKVFVYSIIILFAIMSFSFSSRSWLIQSVIWLIAYTYFSQKNKRAFRLFKTLLVSAIIAGITYFVVQSLFPDLLQILIEKIDPKETREAQYIDLFAQTNLGDFIVGNGYSFSYVSSIQGGQYSYIDNAYLLMLVRYGLLIGLSYPLLFLIPVVKNKFSKEAMPIIMWMMALGGLSIFCGIIIDLKCIALPVVAGRCMYLASEKKKKISEGMSGNE